MTALNVTLDDETEYVRSSAKLRGMSRTALIRKIFDTIVKDQLILSILDDQDEITKLAEPPEPKRRGRPPKSDKPFSGSQLYSGVQRSSSVPTRRTSAPVRQWIDPPLKPPKTRNDMYADLQKAVINTGGELVK